MLPEIVPELTKLYNVAYKTLTWQVILQMFLLFLVSWIIYTQFLKVYISPLRYLPRVPYVPFVGSIIGMMKLESGQYLENWMNKLNASVFRFYWIYGEEKVFVADADLIKAILVTKSKIYKKSAEAYRILKSLLGTGLITSEGMFHRRNRKLCNGSFRFNILKNMIPVFERYSNALIDMWLTQIKIDQSGDKDQSFTEIPIHAEITNFTFDVIGKCAFDYDFNSIQHNCSETTELFRNIVGEFKLTWQRVLPEIIPILRIVKTRSMRNNEQNIEKMDKVVYSVIKKMREELDRSSDESKASNLLESLIRAKDEDTGDIFDDKQIRDEVMTFMLAGHETTAVTISWVLLQMARYPDIQKRVREELRCVLPPEGEAITADHLEQLSYLKCVIDETMRLYPAVIMVIREATEDNSIGEYFFPKGTYMSINISALHRNPKYWDEPLEFRPERFEDPSKIYPYSFIPFIAGSRMCIGYKFAMLEMKTALASLINKFEFKPLPGITYQRFSTVTSRPKPYLILKVRELEDDIKIKV